MRVVIPLHQTISETILASSPTPSCAFPGVVRTRGEAFSCLGDEGMTDGYSPQLENGYTRIANEWLEAFIVSPYPASVKEFVLVVVRETWGYNRKEAEIPISKFQQFFGVTRARIYQIRDDCLRHNIIEIDEGGQFESATYRVQKHYLDWIEWRPKKGNRLHTIKDAVDSQARGRQPSTRSTETVKDAVDSDCQGRGRHNIKDSLKTVKDSTSKAHAPAPAGAAPAPTPDANHSQMPPPPEPKPAREDTPEQACIRRAWEANGFAGLPSGKGYSGLMKLVKEHGIPAVDEWTAHLRASPATVPEGADPWAWFCRAFRDALKRPWEWQRKNGGGGNGDDYRFSDSYRGELPISEVDVTQLTPDGRGGYLF